MKKILSLFFVFLLLTSTAQAFLYDLKILTKQEIQQLDDEALISTYAEAKIEEKTSAEFHQAAGFSNSKEYNKRKDLLRFIIYLNHEMTTRGITPDPIDVWLK